MRNVDTSRRRRRKRKQRIGRIVFVILALAAVLGILGVVRLAAGRQNQSGDDQVASGEDQAPHGVLAEDSQTGQETGEADAALPWQAEADIDSGAEAGTGTGTDAGEDAVFISVDERQVHKGDLVLVNQDHVYDFEANKDLALVNIKTAQTYDYPVSKPEFEVAGHIMASLDQMIRDCDAAMGTAYTGISSAYRTYDYQWNVWQEMAELYGESYSEQYVANPGCSEHHTGLAVDLGIIYEDGSEGSFSESENAVWMKEHCADYGFVRRYAEDKVDITGISNEAWHFRYVGLPHARYMTENNLCLEEYIDYLRSSTSPASPLVVETAEGRFGVYFTDTLRFEAPEKTYTVSGNNVDGCIVTFEL